MKNLLALLLASLLTACGGGGGGGGSPVVDNCPLPILTAAPSNYQGSFTVPTPTLKFHSSISRSIGLKDYNPNNNCAGYSDKAYVATLDRLKDLNVNKVYIYNYAPWDNFANPIWNSDEKDWQISKTQMKFVVDEAKKRNIDVYAVWQFSANDKVGNFLNPSDPVTQPRLEQMLESYRNVIIPVARYYETIGVKGIGLDYNAFTISNLSDHQTVWDDKMISIAQDMRGVFTGKIVYGMASNPNSRADVYTYVDEVMLSLGFTITQAEMSLFSVDFLKTKFINQIQSLADNIPVNVPIHWEINIQSKYDFFVNGWTEDGFCVNNCIQNTYVTDFSVQAVGIESVFQAIYSQTQYNTKTVSLGTGYWHTDTLTPGDEGFPNLSQSIRNKPAENIVKYWFSN